ncbi:MAG TPA: diaminobutyrate--2-oxoglutarate transaminase [Bryobacteraceae bacterium]
MFAYSSNSEKSHTSQYHLDRQAKTESNARTYPRRLPLAIASAQGLFIKDVDGATYMDCLCGAGTLALGHNHPVVIEAIRKHLDAGYPLHTLDLTTPVKDEFVHALFDTLPPELGRGRIQFCSPSGADAVEAAIKLVKTATGRQAIMAFSGGYHGQTHGTLALMGNSGPKVPGLMPDVHFQPFPYAYRCPMGKRDCGDCRCADHTEHQLKDPESGLPSPAGMILEAVQGEGGSVPANREWLQQIRRVSSELGIPLIVDEVQTGWGRTGTLYAFEQANIVPDVLVLSKAIGGGLPLAVVVYRASLDKWQPGAHAGTFRGNQLAMAAGLATLRFIQEHDVCSHVQLMSMLFQMRLGELARMYQSIGEVRGRGLMLGIEIVNPESRDFLGRPLGDRTLALRVQAECFRRGLMVELGGRHGAVVRLLPPLIITAEQVDAVCAILADSFQAASRSAGPHPSIDARISPSKARINPSEARMNPSEARLNDEARTTDPSAILCAGAEAVAEHV